MGIVKKIYEKNTSPGVNEGFTAGEEKWLLWQMRKKWWMKSFPYRTYPCLPFRKVVHWHLWGGKWSITLPRPWGKDIFAGLDDDD